MTLLSRARAPLCAAVVLTLVALVPAHPGAAVTRPRGLPPHLGVGLSAQPGDLDGWLPESGVPWDYAYQYLAAGVNTGNGWRHWNERAQFPLWYAQDAAELGAVPVFPYYMLLQSTGPCDGCGEAQEDLSHLNSDAVMADYYRDFIVLMKRLGPGTHGGIRGFGGTAIVHVEPDLSGYAHHAVLDNANCFGFCRGQGNDPALLRASVRSSGVPQVANYPNHFRGFNLALLHLRDRYAPNVHLAFHVSNWSALHDVGSSTDPELRVGALGRRVGAFARRSGVARLRQDTSRYELIFNDVADRDAAYYEQVLGRDVWWDRRNIEVPNFRRWERYLGTITAVTDRPAMVWQIPLGNQHFRTMDNTDGHYQDNRAEYFFAHMDELRDIGVIALLFGRGNDGSTTNDDDRADGVTNPPATCTSDGTSGAPICNDALSRHADDDGGYLRIAARRYLRDPLRL